MYQFFLQELFPHWLPVPPSQPWAWWTHCEFSRLSVCIYIVPSALNIVVVLLHLKSPLFTSNIKSKCRLFYIDFWCVPSQLSTPYCFTHYILWVWFFQCRTALRRQTRSCSCILTCQHYRWINIIFLRVDFYFYSYFKHIVSFYTFHKFVKYYTADVVPI